MKAEQLGVILFYLNLALQPSVDPRRELILHIIEQDSDGSTEGHVVYNLFGTEGFILFILHKDGQEALRLPGNLLSLRGQHSHTADIFPEGELFTSRKSSEAVIICFINSLQGDESINFLSLFHDEDAHVPLAVVAELTSSVDVPHVEVSDVTVRLVRIQGWRLKQIQVINLN